MQAILDRIARWFTPRAKRLAADKRRLEAACRQMGASRAMAVAIAARFYAGDK